MPQPAAIGTRAEELCQYLLATRPYYALRTGRVVERLRAETLEDAEADRAFGRGLRQRLAAALADPVADADRVTAEFLEDACGRLEEAPECWWTAFPFTPYNAYAIAFHGQLVLPAQPLAASHHVDRYLTLLRDFAALIRAQAHAVPRDASG